MKKKSILFFFLSLWLTKNAFLESLQNCSLYQEVVCRPFSRTDNTRPSKGQFSRTISSSISRAHTRSRYFFVDVVVVVVAHTHARMSFFISLLLLLLLLVINDRPPM